MSHSDGTCTIAPYDCAGYQNVKQIGPFTAWKRIYVNSLVCYRYGAELAEDLVPDPDSQPDTVKVFWEQYAGKFEQNDPVFIMDADNTQGEQAVVSSVGTVEASTNTVILTLDRDLQGTFRWGYPGDPRRPNPTARGGTVVRSAQGLNTNEIDLIGVALADAFVEVQQWDFTSGLPALNIFPLNGVYPFPAPEPERAIQARLDLWGWVGGSNVYTLVNGTWTRTDEVGNFTVLSGVASPLENWAFVSAAYWNMFSSSNPILRQREMTAHESVHIYDKGVPSAIGDCSHSANFLGPELCLMNNGQGPASTASQWEDGSVRMFQEQGTGSHHYYWIRIFLDPFP